jgi:ubiquinone/menaquinone biosynthesis C-methylase UbiE
MNPTKLIIIGLSCFVLAYIILCIVKRKKSLPCPASMTFLLENPYIQFVAGSALLIKRMDLQPGMRVLDVGCGPGRLTIPMARHVGPTGEVAALDIQENMLKKLNKRIGKNHLRNIRTILGGAGQNHLKEKNYFDRAILVTVLGEIPDKKNALKEIYQALKPNGILSITEVLPDPDYQRKKTVLKLTESAGFLPERKYTSLLSHTMNFIKPDRP